MNCPHCQKSISLLSPALMGPSKPGGSRKCPHCGGLFSITADKKLAVLVAATAAVISFLVLRPIPYVGPALCGAATVTAVFVIAARLKKFEA